MPVNVPCRKGSDSTDEQSSQSKNSSAESFFNQRMEVTGEAVFPGQGQRASTDHSCAEKGARVRRASQDHP